MATGHAAGMLHEFLSANRRELIGRCKQSIAARDETSIDPAAVDNGVPLFLSQLEGILRVEQTTGVRDTVGSDPKRAPTDIGRSAALHGNELQRLGFTVDQVVHAYGDVCQAITGLAVEQRAPISTDEFRTLNRCLDNAIADAVTAFGIRSDTSVEAKANTTFERLESFGDEQRRLVDIAVSSYAAMKTGNIGLSGATGALLVHALNELRSLPERIRSDFRLAG
jgi:hypothetical protein